MKKFNSFEEFLQLCRNKFGDKFEYQKESFFENEEMIISFHSAVFKMKPTIHLNSKTGFPKTIDYELFVLIAKESLQEEFIDYSFDKNNYIKYAIPMYLTYKGKRCSMKPIDVVRSSRKSKEYLEYKEITSRYTRPELMNKDYPTVYKNIKLRHWNELMRHFDMRTNNKYKFTIENLKDFIDECAEMELTRNDVKRLYPKISQYIRTHRLTELFLQLPLDNKKIEHSYNRKCGIYAYEFFINDEKYVYVGLTCDFKRRDVEHRKEIHGKTTTVFKFAEKHNVDIPKMKIIVDYEDTISAIKDEGRVLNDYINNGWIQLNVEKTGGIGAPSHYGKDRLPIDGYNKELCQLIIKEKGYTNRWLIREIEYNMANWIELNNLWDELVPIINYSFEECLEDALKYKSFHEWARLSPSKAYWAQRRKWNTIITQKRKELKQKTENC